MTARLLRSGIGVENDDEERSIESALYRIAGVVEHGHWDEQHEGNLAAIRVLADALARGPIRLAVGDPDSDSSGFCLSITFSRGVLRIASPYSDQLSDDLAELTRRGAR